MEGGRLVSRYKTESVMIYKYNVYYEVTKDIRFTYFILS